MKKGDVVLVKKGAPIKSMHPRCPKRFAGRDYQVTVFSYYPPSVARGTALFSATGELEDLQFWAYHNHDVAALLGKPGMSDEALFAAGKVTSESPSSQDGRVLKEFEIQLGPARVSWAGTGGYWCETPVEWVEKVG
jgi:hypothetical protein